MHAGSTVSASAPSTEGGLRGFDLRQPTAAVVGAGIAGVHVAYELAQLGFDVTVFERNREVATGETSFALPFVGVGLLEPWLSTAHVSRGILKDLLFPSTCPSIIARDHPFNSVFSATLQRWLYCRTRSAFTEQEVMWYTDNLSRLSVSVVEDIVKRHPEMADHITSTHVDLREVDHDAARAASDVVTRKAVTAHPAPIAIDPVKWTQGLATIAQKKYGVRFALGQRVEGSHTYLKYDVESTKSLLVSRPDTSAPGGRAKDDLHFDVVVYASGAQTGNLTWQSSQVPVVGLAGWAVVLKNPAGKLQTALRTLFSPQPGASVVLSPRCSLFGLSGTSPSSVPHTPDTWYRLSGLLSLDTTDKGQVNVRRVLSRFESYLRVNAFAEVPVTTLLDEPQSAANVQVNEYVRAFTPDGVPIVDHSGGAFNTYVCCGFGDQAPDFAPGASKILCKLVEQQAQVLLEEDRQYAEMHGIATASLPASRRSVVETELEMLMNGVLPHGSGTAQSATGSGGGFASYGARLLRNLRGIRADDDHRSAAAVAEASPTVGETRPSADAVRHVSFEENPFSTDRFRKVIPKEVKDVTHRSPLSRLYDAEQALSESAEPVLRRFRRRLVQMAREDNIPDSVRSLALYIFYDPADDVAEHEQLVELSRRMHALSQQLESDPSNTSRSPHANMERSAEKQAEMARRAREVFYGGDSSAAKS